MTDLELLLRFLKTDHPPPGEVVFAKIGGSRCHNLNLPTSDHDYIGVYACPSSEVLGLDGYTETMTYDSDESERNKDTKPDHTFHEVGKFCKLLLKGNPGIVEMLYTEKKPSTAIWTAYWDELREHRKKFLTQLSVKQYLGFIAGQLERIRKSKKEHGYKEKWVYHILRLAHDAHTIAIGKEPVLWWKGKPRDELLKVRNYEYLWGNLEERILEAVKKVEDLKPWSNLPEEGDKEFLNKWLLKIRRAYW